MKASVIVSFYKNIPNLGLILNALNCQTTKNKFEVILSEDDDAAETVQFINSIRHQLKFPLVHVYQKDIGFRKCAALNRAVQASNSGFLVFLDGDCIPHKDWVNEYIKEQKPKTVLFGRRVFLSEAFSGKILLSGNLKMLKILNLLLFKCKRIEEGLYSPFLNRFLKEKKEGILLGCNMAINKIDLLAINGFDEDYIFPGGGEDSDIEWRLKTVKGIRFKSMKHRSIVYHLFHETRFTSEKEKISLAFMTQKKTKGISYCVNGIQK